MRILHLLQSNHFSGAENVVCQIIDMFRDDEEIEMIYSSTDGQIREALSERNIEFAPMKELSVSEAKRVISEVKPDIIHAHDMKASFIAAIAGKKIPLISHIHNNAFASRGLSLKSIGYLLAAIKAKHIFWVSESSYKGYFFGNLFKEKSSVLYNIVNIDKLYSKAESDNNSYNYDVVYVGRMTYPKNPQRLMEVIRKISKKKPDIRVAVAGNGDLEKETRSLCEKYALANNVDFLGFVDNPLKIIKSAKVMIMTSRWEGTPMCALEALALGVPVVSTPVDGLKNLIINDKNGYLSDNDDILAQKIVDIVNNKVYNDILHKNAILTANEKMNINNYKKQLILQYKYIN